MKKIILFFIAFPFFCFCQTSNMLWQSSFGGSEFDVANAVASTSDGGIVFAGETNSSFGDTGANNNSKFNLWVVKLNAAGAIQWQKSFGGTKNEKAYSVIETNDLGIIVVGFNSSTDNEGTVNKGNSDYWIIKFSAIGLIEWQKTFGGSGSEEAYKIKQTKEGDYIVAGVTNSNDGDVSNAKGNQDFWIIKISSAGNLIWQKSIGGSQMEQLNGLLLTTDGGFIATGRTNSADGDVVNLSSVYCGWMVKVTSSGEIEWQKCYESGIMDIQYSNAPNEYVVTGYGEGLGGDSWIAKMDTSGSILWKTSFGGSGYDLPRAVALTTDEGFLTCGVTYSADGDVTNYKGEGDFWLVKFDKNGNLKWQKTFGGSGGDIPYAMTLSSTAEIILAGTTNSTNGDVTVTKGKSDVWIVKLGAETLQTPSFSKNSVTHYPNPATNLLNLIGIDLNQEKKIVVVDSNGKIVLNKSQKSNSIEVENLKHGVYFIKVTTQANTYRSKFIKN